MEKNIYRVEKCRQPSHQNAIACCLFADIPVSKNALIPILVSLSTTLKHPSDLTVLAPREARDMLVSVSIDLAEQPVSHTDYSVSPFRARSLVGVFNCMFGDSTLLVKLKDEETAELFIVPRLAAENIGNSFYLLVGSDTTVNACRVLISGLAT
jgi:hypothetical protein